MAGSRGGEVAARAAAGLAYVMIDGKLSRNAEHEADLLAIQYVYASGYDPASYVQFFEKIRMTEKKKPSLIGRAFASHPPTDDRIRRCQEEIENYLPMRESYMVTTSGFDEMKAQLISVLNRRKVAKESEIDAPILRKTTKNTTEEKP
jgi:predicted Zn-dependent protease